MTFPTTYLPYRSPSHLFSLAVKHTKTRTYIVMQVMTDAVNTRDIPQTLDVLADNLPSIFESRCFNDDQLPFSVEVLSTEIGHLFEHVLLEYLCELKLQTGVDHAVYQGLTSWNWVRDPRGMFHITINAGLKDAQIFSTAMQQAIHLVDFLLQTVIYTNDIPREVQYTTAIPPISVSQSTQLSN